MSSVFLRNIVLGSIVGCIGLFLFANDIFAATFTVNSTLDDDDESCTHPYVDSTTDCTLREAVAAANSTSGVDTINFAMANVFPGDGAGQWTITSTRTGDVFPFTEVVILDASSIWDADQSRPGIKISALSSTTVFKFSGASDTNKVKGMEISSSTTGILVSGTTSMIIGTDCDGTSDVAERNVVYGATTNQISVENASNTKLKGNYIGIQNDGLTLPVAGSIGIVLSSSTASTIGFEESGVSSNCAAALQRNVIGTKSAGPAHGIRTTGSVSDLKIMGNYIGVGTDGVTDITTGSLNNGIDIGIASSLVTIGTNGNGTSDTFEANVIAGWNGDGISSSGSVVRISGNLIGFTSSGSTALANRRGIDANAASHIIGWCDTTIHTSLCSDLGLLANQQNIIGNSTTENIHVGSRCDSCKIYGNFIGTDRPQTSDFGSSTYGILMERGADSVSIGQSLPAQRNFINYNDLGGVLIDATHPVDSTNYLEATENYVIQNNVISSNGVFGLRIVDTERNGTAGVSDGSIISNTLQSNAGSGIVLIGSSPTVTLNTINSNTSYGILVQSTYRVDVPSFGTIGTIYNNTYDSLSPNNASFDDISKPSITTNTISGNASGGIYIFDASADNISTIATDNTIGVNGTFDVKKSWYGALELINQNGSSNISSETLTVTLTPANSLTCPSTCTASVFASNSTDTSLGIWGTTGVNYDNATTWLEITDLIIDSAGNTSLYNPYTLTVSSTSWRPANPTQYSFDGNSANDTSTVGLPAGTATQGISRYQIAELILAQTKGSPLPSVYMNGTILPPVALSSDTIRWYFRFSPPTETTFELLNQENELISEQIEQLPTKTFFVDETGLESNTQYCGRSIRAKHSSGISSQINFPCVTTLQTGETAPEEGVAELTLTQRVYRFVEESTADEPSTTSSAAAPLSAFTVFLITGGGHVLHRRRKGCTTKNCFSLYTKYIVGGFATSGSILGITLFLAWSPTAQLEEPASTELITSETELHQGDRILVEFVVENIGTGTAKGVKITHPIDASLQVNSSISDFTAMDGFLVATIDELYSATSQTLSYEALVLTDFANIVSGAFAKAEGIPKVFSNMITLAIRNQEQVEEEEQTALEEGAQTEIPSQTYPVKSLALVSSQEGGAVYVIDSSLVKRLFPSRQIFDSWFDNFRRLKILSEEDLDSIPEGSPMLGRPGTWLVKVPEDNKVFAVEPGYVLRWIIDEESAQTLFGENWNRRIIDVDQEMFSTYSIAVPLPEGEFPDGIILEGETLRCYIQDNTCRELSENGVLANQLLESYFIEWPDEELKQLPLGIPITGRDETVLFGK